MASLLRHKRQHLPDGATGSRGAASIFPMVALGSSGAASVFPMELRHSALAGNSSAIAAT
ncbi:MAG: hypothetical protein PUI09_03300 [bacterium]|nr:hypothetical protein [bacterium]